jgi:N-hydroxyarylamine O-acetyltransferase
MSPRMKPMQMHSIFLTYLKILDLKIEKPSLDFLKKLVSAQLRNFPYENISKLQQAAQGNLRLLTLEEHLEGQMKFGFGGTCYAQNIYFSQLLDQLGYKTTLVSASVDGFPGHLIAIRVVIDSQSYIVDFGFLDAFSGPFEENGNIVESWLGGRLFRFIPQDNLQFRIEIYREEKLQLHFQSEKIIQSLDEIIPSIQESFKSDALFMNNLVIGKRFGSPCLNLWNQESIITMGSQIEKRKLKSVQDLCQFVWKDMKLANYPIEESIDFLTSRGIKFF